MSLCISSVASPSMQPSKQQQQLNSPHLPLSVQWCQNSLPVVQSRNPPQPIEGKETLHILSQQQHRRVQSFFRSRAAYPRASALAEDGRKRHVYRNSRRTAAASLLSILIHFS